MVEGKIWLLILLVTLIPVSLYFGISVIFYVLQPRFIYFPYREITATPQETGLSYEDVYFEASDGVKLHGWFIPNENPRGVVLFCHGNGGNISNRLESIGIFHRLGLSTFIFDYRGYGRSDGAPTEQRTYLDAEAAWSYLVHERGLSPSQIVFFGRSLGGSIAAWLAKDNRPRAVIVESAFTSVGDIGSQLYPYLPVRMLSRFDYNTLEYLSQVRSPVLIVHSQDDELIPFNHGLRLFEAANEPKEFLEITGTHNEGFRTTGKHYEDGLKSFISKYAR